MPPLRGFGPGMNGFYTDTAPTGLRVGASTFIFLRGFRGPVDWVERNEKGGVGAQNTREIRPVGVSTQERSETQLHTPRVTDT